MTTPPRIERNPLADMRLDLSGPEPVLVAHASFGLSDGDVLRVSGLMVEVTSRYGTADGRMMRWPCKLLGAG